MNATSLIQQIGAAGGRLEIVGEDIRLVRPKGVVIPQSLLQAARDAKAEIRNALSQAAPERADAANLDERAATMEYDGKLPRAWAKD